MLAVEKTHGINVEITGEGASTVGTVLRSAFPDVVITDDDNETEIWKDTDLAKDIEASTTPGKLLGAYRERAGLSLLDLARKVGTKYPNISAMENDRRAIGLKMAKKLGRALDVDFRKFLME